MCIFRDIFHAYKGPCTYAFLRPPAFFGDAPYAERTLARSVPMLLLFWCRLVFKSKRLHKLSRLAAFKENALINSPRLWNATSWPAFCGCWWMEFITFNPLSSSAVIFCIVSSLLRCISVHPRFSAVVYFLEQHLCLKTTLLLTHWWVQTFEPQSHFHNDNRSANSVIWKVLPGEHFKFGTLRCCSGW